MLWLKQARFSVKGPDLIRGSKFLVTPVHLPQEGLGFFVLFCLGAAIIATWCIYSYRPYRLFFSCVYFGGQCWHLSFYVSLSFKLLPTYFHVTSLRHPCLASDLPHRGLPFSSLFSPELMPDLPGPLYSLPLSPPPLHLTPCPAWAGVHLPLSTVPRFACAFLVLNGRRLE